MSRSKLTKAEVLKKVVTTPRSGGEIAKLLGAPDYRSVSRILGDAVKAKEIKRVSKGKKTGYVKA